MAFIIQQSSNIINVIDTTMPDISERIVDAFSLDSVAKPVPQTAPNLDKLKIYSSNGDFKREFILDGTLQTQDLNSAPVTWAGTLDELANKINNDYFLEQSGGGSLVDLDIKEPGYIWDLTTDDNGDWQGFSFDAEYILIQAGSLEKEVLPRNNSASITLTNVNTLIDFLNQLQPYFAFKRLTATTILIKESLWEIPLGSMSIQIEDLTNGNTLEYTTFTATSQQPVSNIDVISRELEALNKSNKSVIYRPSFAVDTFSTGTNTIPMLRFKNISLRFWGSGGKLNSIPVPDGFEVSIEAPNNGYLDRGNLSYVRPSVADGNGYSRVTFLSIE